MGGLLDIEGLDAAYDEVEVLHGVNLSVAEEGITAVLGANGAGKTTLLRAICNMMVRKSGRIAFAGQRIDNQSTESIARLGIAHVPDGRGTFVSLTVEENLRLGASLRRDTREIKTDFERVFTLFPRLQERRWQQAGTLSGGEQQMLAISRTLMQRPRLILLDEPSFGLAPLVVREIFTTLEAINRQDRVSLLLVEQNANLALKLATHAYVLSIGRVVLSGPSAEVRRNETVQRAYLGT